MTARRRNGSRLADRVRPGVVVLVGLGAAAGFVCGVVVDRPSPPRLTVVGPAGAEAPAKNLLADGAVLAGLVHTSGPEEFPEWRRWIPVQRTTTRAGAGGSRWRDWQPWEAADQAPVMRRCRF